MRIYLDQIGCRLNYSEMETLAQRLVAAGHQLVDGPEAAQVVVFNSCAVTLDAAAGSRKQLRHLHAVNPTARIVVTGCWSTLEPVAAAALPGVALVTPNAQKELLHTLLEPWSADFDDPADLTRLQPNALPLDFAQSPVDSEQLSVDSRQSSVVSRQSSVVSRQFPISNLQSPVSRTRAFVKVQDGCNNQCTFCIVTIARGESRSRPLRELVDEVQALVAAGVQEAVLTGVHLGSYGRELADSERSDLKTLVATLLTETAIPRLRLSSLEPWELAPGFFELWRQWPGRLCPHLHLPLQAGTDRQLRRMARRCTVASFRQLVVEARTTIPDLVLTTDLIVGFPGESERDFAQGMDFVREMRFAHAHIFPFSPRPGTAAVTFADQVPSPLKKARARQLYVLVEETGRAERLRFVGQTRPVLWEGEGQLLTDQPGRLWRGLTDNYLRVMAVAPEGQVLHNTITPVRLDELQSDTLFGTIL
jgi:threonylcarbamoyladenosine tRNA methylthiotransferase MtaB